MPSLNHLQISCLWSSRSPEWPPKSWSSMATWEAWQTPAKRKGFSSVGPFFAFKAGFLASLGIFGHWALLLPASSNILALMRSQRAQAEYPRSSLSSRQYICIYHSRNNISICRKQLLPPGLQHPRTKISPTNLIYFPMRVLEVWNCLCFHFYGPRGKISIKFSICLLLCGSLRFNHIICNENKATFKIFFFKEPFPPETWPELVPKISSWWTSKGVR